MSKIIGYCRVSIRTQLDGNSLEQQSLEIRSRYNNAIIIEDSTVVLKMIAKLNVVIAGLIAGFILVVTKIDCFCRTVTEGWRYVEELHRRGVIIHILNMGLVENCIQDRHRSSQPTRSRSHFTSKQHNPILCFRELYPAV